MGLPVSLVCSCWSQCGSGDAPAADPDTGGGFYYSVLVDTTVSYSLVNHSSVISFLKIRARFYNQ